jgi:serine/threonine-protein kinase
MSDDSRLEKLLGRYEALRAQKESVPAEELCRDCPELLEEFKRQVRALESVDALLRGAYKTRTLPPAAPAEPEAEVAKAPVVGEDLSAASRYRLLRFHARGGLGEVHVAQDETLHREVALKRLRREHAATHANRRRFLWEAEVTSLLDHPNVAPVHALGQDAENRPFYAMRFIQGETLQEAVRRHYADLPTRDLARQGLALRQLLARFVAVCNTIAYAHSRGILHRDIKPANIVLGAYGETMVLDWGLAKNLKGTVEGLPAAADRSLAPAADTDATELGSVIGTPAYMSPEQAQGLTQRIGTASDIYSLGVTLYYLLTGQIPFQAQDVAELLEKTRRGDLIPVRQRKTDVPPALEAICHKAMALRPEARYPTALRIAEDLEHWLADEPVSAWREPWTVRARRWVGRHRTLVTSAVATIGVATLILASSTVLLTQANERERKQKENAEVNFGLARQAVDHYYTEVSENTLLHEPGMEPLRKKLLESARAFYERFVSDHQDDSSVKAELGRALFRLSKITADIGSLREAISLDQRALTSFVDLSSEFRADVADCQHQLGRLYRLTDQTAEAEAAYDQALALWKTLTAESPTENRYRAALARTWIGLGNEYRLTGRMDSSGQAYGQAIAILRELTAAQPEIPEYQRDLAVTYCNSARVYSHFGQVDRAEHAFGQALILQEKLASSHSSVTQYQNDLARTHFNLATVRKQSGQTGEAESSYRQAEAEWHRLAQAHPSVTEYRVNLATTANNLGNLYRSLGQPAKAEASYSQALTLQEALVREHPGTPVYESEFARLHFNIGAVARATGQSLRARTSYQASLAMREKLARAYPEVLQYQEDLAESQMNLGSFLTTAGESAQARELLEKACAVRADLARRFPDSPEHIIAWGASCVSFAHLLRDRGEEQKSCERYAEAIRLLEPVARNSKRQQQAQEELRKAYSGRATALAKGKRYAEAVRDWDRAIALDKGASPWFRLYRAQARARAGDHAGAEAEAAALGQQTGTADALYQLATVDSLSADAALKDAKLTPSERHNRAEAYALCAMDFLMKAQKAGYFKKLANFKKLKDDAALDPLRPRQAFQKLLAECDKVRHHGPL